MTPASKVTLAFLVGAMALGLVSMTAVPAKAASVPYDLYGSAATGWGLTATSETNPGPMLSANAGDTVTITLHSTDGFTHQLLIDYNGNGRADAGEPMSAQFTTTTTLTFVASQAGTFSYLCLVHPSLMTGTFTVQGTGTGTPTGDSTSTLVIVGIAIGIAAVAGVSILVLRSRN